jgi:hypothetical protein
VHLQCQAGREGVVTGKKRYPYVGCPAMIRLKRDPLLSGQDHYVEARGVAEHSEECQALEARFGRVTRRQQEPTLLAHQQQPEIQQENRLPWENLTHASTVEEIESFQKSRRRFQNTYQVVEDPNGSYGGHLEAAVDHFWDWVSPPVDVEKEIQPITESEIHDG